MLNNSFANSLKFSLFDFIGNSIIKGGSKASEMRELLSNNVIDKIGDAISIPQSNTLLNIIENESEPLIAYQICFNLYDTQNHHILEELSFQLNELVEGKDINKEIFNKIVQGKAKGSIKYEVKRSRKR